MDKKIVIGITIVLLIIVGVVVFFFFKGNKMNDNQNLETSANIQEYYGKRGDITETERIKFLSQNDEYLVGMMGLAVKNEVTNFSNEDMIRFALNIAVERYETMLATKKNKDGSFQYIITEDVVADITNEFFGIKDVEFSKSENKYYSTSNKAFLFNENIEKTLYYYPVTEEKKEDGTTQITVDAIFISDSDINTLEKAKYEGKYLQDNIDNTIRFTFNKDGKLVSYQYL